MATPTNTNPVATPEELQGIINRAKELQSSGQWNPEAAVLPTNVVDASKLTTSNVPVVKTDTTPPATPVLANATTAGEVAKASAAMLEQERLAQQKAFSDAGISGSSGKQAIFEAVQNIPSVDKSGQLKTSQEQYGIPTLVTQTNEQLAKVAEYKATLENINLRETAEKENIESRMVSRDAADAENATLTRKYNLEKAKATGDYNLEVAKLSALNGQLENANALVEQAVNAYTYDQEQKVKRFETLLSVGSDWVDSLDKEEKALVEKKYQEAQDKLKNDREDKKSVLSLLIDNPQAGIIASDSMEQAAKKIGLSPKKDETIIGSSSDGYYAYDKNTGKTRLIKAGTGTGATSSKEEEKFFDDTMRVMGYLSSGVMNYDQASYFLKTKYGAPQNVIDNYLSNTGQSRYIQSPTNPNANIPNPAYTPYNKQKTGGFDEF